MPVVLSKNKKHKKTTNNKPVKKNKVSARKNLSASFNEVKEFEGRQYTGMQIGRSHKWNYDKGEWFETKITPDLWEISYAVTKRRAGHAPEGSGASVGTAYHWYILAHQNVKKLNANDYTTSMHGIKFKLAHKRADKEKWSATAPTQRKHLILFLEDVIKQLKSKPMLLEFEYAGKQWHGEGIPLPETCHDGVCYELDIMLNDENLGIIHRAKSGWKMKLVKDQKLINAIGQQIQLGYE